MEPFAHNGSQSKEYSKYVVGLLWAMLKGSNKFENG